MASRGGKRAAGTDGSDYSHRERVASHYTESVQFKQKIRYSLIPHMFMTFLTFAKMIIVRMGNTYFLPLLPWEMVWLISGVGAYIGYGALPKNSRLQLMVYLVCNVLFGLIPLLIGGAEGIIKMKTDFKDMRPPPSWKNTPSKFAVIVFCCQVQLMGLFHGIRLLRAWGKKGKSQ